MHSRRLHHLAYAHACFNRDNRIPFGRKRDLAAEPSNADWNFDSGGEFSETNWSNGEVFVVPNGPADTATFNLPIPRFISRQNRRSTASFLPRPPLPTFITASSGFTLTISGAGIMNDSGKRTQDFVTLFGIHRNSLTADGGQCDD